MRENDICGTKEIEGWMRENDRSGNDSSLQDTTDRFLS
jgi:hypothetical protein